MLEVQELYYEVGSMAILQNISGSFLPGKLTVLLGANGAGKSTLLKLLAGEKTPERGVITLNGKSIIKYKPNELALIRAVLTQQYSLSLPFKCNEVVMMGRYPHFNQRPAITDEKIIRLTIQDMKVDQLSGRWFHTLSGGEQQRVQMARVLAQLYPIDSLSGKFLLLDEPTSSMDCLHQQLCLTKAKTLAEEGCTVIVVLHDLNLAAQFADHLFLLKNGKLLKTGTPSEVLQPSLIHEAYGFETDVIHHPDYDFPIIIPAQFSKKSISENKKIA